VFSVLRLFVIRGGGASFSVSIELVPSPFFEEVEGRSFRCIFVIREGNWTWPWESTSPEPCAKARATQQACGVRHPNGEGEGPSLPGWARSRRGDRRCASAPGAGAAAPAAWPSSPSWARSHQWQDRRTAEATGAGAEAPAACESACAITKWVEHTAEISAAANGDVWAPNTAAIA
jgi:hypothetical protein